MSFNAESSKLPCVALDSILLDFVCRAQKPLVDVCACSGCGEQASVTKMYTCETCQETLNTKPVLEAVIRSVVEFTFRYGFALDAH